MFPDEPLRHERSTVSLLAAAAAVNMEAASVVEHQIAFDHEDLLTSSSADTLVAQCPQLSSQITAGGLLLIDCVCNCLL